MADEKTLNEDMKEETINESAEELKEDMPCDGTEAVDTEDTENAAQETEADETEAEDTPDGAEPKEEKAKKGLFAKKDKKKDEQAEKIAELTDRLQRLMAEFDNYRKRTEKEKAQMYDMGVSSAIEKLLPVVDNLERGIAAVPEDKKDDPIAAGMDQIYRQTVKILTDMGVEPIDAAGKEFDPNLHNAVMQVENDELESNTVAAELQKGYTYKNTVIRHSMVSVVS